MFDDNLFTIATSTVWDKQRWHVTQGQGHIQGQMSNLSEIAPIYHIDICFIRRLSYKTYIFTYQNTLLTLRNENM